MPREIFGIAVLLARATSSAQNVLPVNQGYIKILVAPTGVPVVHSICTAAVQQLQHALIVLTVRTML
jgi:hypothetical protein